jgi:hypothetical protein
VSTPLKAFLIGCGALLVLGVGGCFVVVSFLLKQPEDIEVSVDAPARVAEGETFLITARARNTGDEPRRLVDLDLADEYLEGVLILGTEPAYRDSMHVPIDNTVSYEFELAIPPGGVAEVMLEAQALRAGDFSGDFDFCIDSETSCLSSHVRTFVDAEPVTAEAEPVTVEAEP